MIPAFIAALLAAGLFLLFEAAFQPPSLKERALIKKLGKPKRKINFEQLLVLPAARRIARHIRMSKEEREQLRSTLEAAGMDMTPEVYKARPFVLMGLVFLFALASFLTKIYLLAAVFVLTAIVAFLKVRDEAQDRMKKRQESIREELPQFMRTVTQSLLYDRDILSIVDKYRAVSGDGLRYELGRLVTAMKSGNHEQALTDFADRIQIDYLTTFVSGLVSQSKGIDQKMFLRMTEDEVKKISVERIKQKAFKKPEKLRLAQAMLVISIILLTFSILLVQVFQGLQIFH